MHGHFLGGTRKLNRHYQNGDMLAHIAIAEHTASRFGFLYTRISFPENSLSRREWRMCDYTYYFGYTTDATTHNVISTEAYPFSIQWYSIPDDTSSGYADILHVESADSEVLPLGGGTFDLYDSDKESNVGTCTVERVSDTLWKYTTDYTGKVYMCIWFLYFDDITASATVQQYIGLNYHL